MYYWPTEIRVLGRPNSEVILTSDECEQLESIARCFGLITQQAIRRGSFNSVPDLVQRIKQYTEH